MNPDYSLGQQLAKSSPVRNKLASGGDVFYLPDGEHPLLTGPRSFVDVPPVMNTGEHQTQTIRGFRAPENYSRGFSLKRLFNQASTAAGVGLKVAPIGARDIKRGIGDTIQGVQNHITNRIVDEADFLTGGNDQPIAGDFVGPPVPDDYVNPNDFVGPPVPEGRAAPDVADVADVAGKSNFGTRAMGTVAGAGAGAASGLVLHSLLAKRLGLAGDSEEEQSRSRRGAAAVGAGLGGAAGAYATSESGRKAINNLIDKLTGSTAKA